VWSGTAALAAMVLAGVLLHNGPSVPSRVPSRVPPAQTAMDRPLPPPIVLHQQRRQADATSSAKAGAPPGHHDRQLQAAPGVSGVAGGIANRAATPAFGAATQSSVAVAASSDALQMEKVAVRSMLLPDEAQVILSHHPLPSGLPAVSAVANGRQAIAIDTHNSLFLSDDGGEHWSAISPPWQDRAVKVALASSTPGNSVDAMGAGAQFRPSPAPVMGLVTSASATQAKSSIRGEVTDPSGAIIPNASVVVTNSLTQVAHTTKTDGSGHYAADNLAPGPYVVEAEAPGFVSQQLSGIALNPGQQSQMNLRLAVGSLSQTVEVQGQNGVVSGASAARKAFAARRPILSRFEITTDTGEQWTSTDGRSWKRK
jgi:hypothetical protein